MFKKKWEVLGIKWSSCHVLCDHLLQYGVELKTIVKVQECKHLKGTPEIWFPQRELRVADGQEGIVKSPIWSDIANTTSLFLKYSNSWM
jgi:hypothetical protein